MILKPTLLTLHIATIALIVVLLIAIPLARWVVHRPQKRWYLGLLEGVIQLPLLLPPSVIGYLVISLLGRYTPVGGWLYEHLGVEFLFHRAGAVLVAVIVALPLMYVSAKHAFSGVDPVLREITLQEGASRWHYLLHVELPLTRNSLLQGGALSFARACGEFGATLMVLGYIPGKSGTLSTSLFYAVEQMDRGRSFALFGIILAIQGVTLFLVSRLRSQDNRILY